MENNTKISFKVSLLFALFQVFMLWSFDVYSFFEEQSNALFFYLEVILTTSLIHFILSFVFSKSKPSEKKSNIYFSLNFILSSILSSIVCWLISSGSLSILLLVISSFLIPSLFPAIAFFLKMIFQEVKIDEVRAVDNVTVSQEVVSQLGVVNNVQSVETVVALPVVEKPIQFVLENENGKILLDVPIKSIICFEANDNYVVTYYLDREERLKKSMERISLKKIEEIVETLKVETFTRVHKSYLINKSYLEEIKGKAQAHKLKMYHLELVIPVSRAYPINTLKEY